MSVVELDRGCITCRIVTGTPLPPAAWPLVARLARQIEEADRMVRHSYHVRVLPEDTGKKRHALTPARLTQIADAYRAGGPLKVMAACGLSRSQAYRLIRLAREAGHLGPSEVE